MCPKNKKKDAYKPSQLLGILLKTDIPMPHASPTKQILQLFLTYWSKYTPHAPWQEDWVNRHARIVRLAKHDFLYSDVENKRSVFIVVRGLLAHTLHEEDSNKRKILAIAEDGMAFMTTHHLHSHTPVPGEILALRNPTDIIEISYQAIQNLIEKAPAVNTLMHMLTNKKKKQLLHFHIAFRLSKPYEAYAYFVDQLPQLKSKLTQQEIADILNISVSSVKRASKRHLFQK